LPSPLKSKIIDRRPWSPQAYEPRMSDRRQLTKLPTSLPLPTDEYPWPGNSDRGFYQCSS
jgi:hypothetical protein